MNFSAEDVAIGYKNCDCGKRFVLEAGTDYPDECWEKCIKCHSWVVNLNKDVKSNLFVIE